MPEYRQNMLTNEWVIISTERAKRPEDFKKTQELKPELPAYQPQCPFCQGNETKTPPSTLEIQQQGKWAVRVVPNKFAAVQKEIEVKREQVGRFLKESGYGIAEVIIETPVHNLTLATMDLSQVQNVISAYQQRYQKVGEQKHINLITIFRNHGLHAGTSLEHSHSQLIATPIIPPHVRNPISQAVLYHDNHDHCIYCDMLLEEKQQKDRIVLETEHFLAYTPFASRTPFEMRIMPKRHQASFAQITENEQQDFAYILQNILARVYQGLENPDYNFIIRSCPVGDEECRYLHWYLVIIPKLTTPAGFEIGTGIYINVSYPEECAKFLRNFNLTS